MKTKFAEMKISGGGIAIVGALAEETAAFLSEMTVEKELKWCDTIIYQGQFHDTPCLLTNAGVGKVATAMATQHLIDRFQPDAIIFSGLAGAINPDYEIGDVVIARDCVQHDLDASEMGFPRGTVPYTNFRFFETDEALREMARSARVLHKIHEGRIVSGDQFITKRELSHMSYLTDELMGDAVEMEGGAMGQVCAYNKVPYLVIRTISDKANSEAFVDFSRFINVVAKNSFDILSHLFLELKSRA